jgi:uncharacterized repeat protein (TIGR03803 family)
MKKSIFAALYILFTHTLVAQTPGFLGVTEGISGGGSIYFVNPVNNYVTNWGVFPKEIETNNYPNGSGPTSGLVYNPVNGLYYGMTGGGGSCDSGTIYSFNPNIAWYLSENVIYDFGCNDSNDIVPSGTLVYYPPNGLYYGIGSAYPSFPLLPNNGGGIFSLNPNTNSVNIVYRFSGAPSVDGSSAGIGINGPLIYDTLSGLMYGTGGGGTRTYGTIYSFNPVTNVVDKLYNFGDTALTIPHNSGAMEPAGHLIYINSTGLYYGVFASGWMTGSAFQNGGLYSFNPRTDSVNILFPESSPMGSLVYCPLNGLYYGVTVGGGDSAQGSIYSFNPVTGKDSTVWSFGNIDSSCYCCNRGAAEGYMDGKWPSGELIFYPDSGLFYGTTSAVNCGLCAANFSTGTLFKFNPVTNKERIIDVFGNYTFGCTFETINANYPIGQLVPCIINPTGINTISNKPESINIYPNPTNGLLTITGLIKGQSIALYNAIGQNLGSIVASSTIQQIDISAQDDGIYLIQVLNKDNTVISQKKVIKSN